jgi:hypothetical protein
VRSRTVDADSYEAGYAEGLAVGEAERARLQRERDTFSLAMRRRLDRLDDEVERMIDEEAT